MEHIKIINLLVSILCCVVLTGLNVPPSVAGVSTQNPVTNGTTNPGLATQRVSTPTQRLSSTSRSTTERVQTKVSTQLVFNFTQRQQSSALPISSVSRYISTTGKRISTPRGQFQCHDGSKTLNATLFCNGRIDCPDSSDENSQLCNGSSCMNTFPCLNGKCVGLYSACNGPDECGDNSDEQLPLCRWPSPEIHVHVCKNGQVLVGINITCNGVYNCMDKSDEFNCTKCPGGLSCDKGRRCVKVESICDRVQDCYDGADETCLRPENHKCNVGDFICPTGMCVPQGRFISGSRCWGSQGPTREDNQNFCKSPNVLCDDGYKCIPPEYRCDGKRDCQDGADEMSPDGNIMSVPSYPCGNGYCVPYLALCNGTNECGDNSDEDFGNGQCPFSAKNCNSVLFFYYDYWHCNNGLCVIYYKVHDGINNCGDFSDEKNSTVFFFNCTNGKKLLRSFMCDGQDNCGDSSDETDLLCTVNATRQTCSQVSCPSGKCIPYSYICDGDNDCGDYSDELSCLPKPACRQRTCPSGRCINFNDVCDGVNNCGDNSDETGCPSCYSFQFKCTSGECISASQRCDGTYDCNDFSDESACLNPICSGHTCPSGACILSSQVCDGINDCGDNSDETDWPCSSNTCPEHTCLLGKCVFYSDVCNGVDDCGDDSDESFCTWTYTHTKVTVGVCVPGFFIIAFGSCYGARRRRIQARTRTTRAQVVTTTTTVASNLPPSYPAINVSSNLPPSYAEVVGSSQGYTNQAFGSSAPMPS